MIEKLQNILLSGEAALIESPENRRYFTGINTSNGVLAVTHDSACFFTDFRYITAAKNNINKGIGVRLIDENKAKSFSDFLKGTGTVKIYYEENYLSCREFRNYQNNLSSYELAEGEEKITAVRQIKTPEEIENIKAAQKITDDAFLYICDYIRSKKNSGLTEKMIAFELEFFMRRSGSGKMPFAVIAASGPNSALPHAEPSDRNVQPGDFITMDYGSTVNDYCSDMTRTVAVGDVSDKQAMVYDIVLRAQKEALKKIRSGITGREADSYARDIISYSGYGSYFGHSLGHSVGLYIHEEPNFSPGNKNIIPENAVISVEPGIYIEGEFGVRIEDLVVVRKNGIEDLTNSDKKLLIL